MKRHRIELSERKDSGSSAFLVTIECSHLEENARDNYESRAQGHRCARAGRARDAARRKRLRAVPRAPDLSLDLPIRSHRFRPDDRLSRTLRQRLQDQFVITTPHIVSDETSA